MIRYILKRLAQSVVVLFFISVVSFSIIHVAPGSPVGNTLNPKASPEDSERMRREFNLDKPPVVQYFLWLNNLFTGQLRGIQKDRAPVLVSIGRRLPFTLLLNLVSMIIIFAIAIPLGVYSATHRYSLGDHATTVMAYVGISIPSFFLAYLLILLFVNVLGLPILGARTFGLPDLPPLDSAVDFLTHLVVPAFLIAFGGIASMSRYMRASMLEVRSQDYIRTARAKGLPEDDVNYRHALKNAMLPIVTIFGLMIPSLIGGTVIIETIFALPGIGRLFFESAMSRDYPILLTLNFLGAILVVLGNLVADVLYRYADPRIKLG